ncbi:hypothetical protein [Occallatibacter riparius]|uniref:Uncharacterized protein n=1 Tax=Occallatibacter riparius TaxID=1002689 RepID=A0A9J7BUS3_9BACT|nr:hypothetical protein [Occallatibacter riparius]UWZ86627.1 hypothetical protein MOP44_11935 [Occallatibacter riparius]
MLCRKPSKNTGTPQLRSASPAHRLSIWIVAPKGSKMVDYDALSVRMNVTRLRIQIGNSSNEQQSKCVAETIAMISQTQERIVQTDVLIADLREALVGAAT